MKSDEVRERAEKTDLEREQEGRRDGKLRDRK